MCRASDEASTSMPKNGWPPAASSLGRGPLRDVGRWVGPGRARDRGKRNSFKPVRGLTLNFQRTLIFRYRASGRCSMLAGDRNVGPGRPSGGSRRHGAQTAQDRLSSGNSCGAISQVLPKPNASGNVSVPELTAHSHGRSQSIKGTKPRGSVPGERIARRHL